MNASQNSFEVELRQLFRHRATADRDFAVRLYASLCNVEWQRGEVGHSMSWRAAGGLVSELCGGRDYLDFYLSGGEGIVDPEVAEALAERGWKPETDDAKWFRT